MPRAPGFLSLPIAVVHRVALIEPELYVKEIASGRRPPFLCGYAPERYCGP